MSFCNYSPWSNHLFVPRGSLQLSRGGPLEAPAQGAGWGAGVGVPSGFSAAVGVTSVPNPLWRTLRALYLPQASGPQSPRAAAKSEESAPGTRLHKEK